MQCAVQVVVVTLQNAMCGTSCCCADPAECNVGYKVLLWRPCRMQCGVQVIIVATLQNAIWGTSCYCGDPAECNVQYEFL